MSSRSTGLDWRGDRLLLAATSQESGRLVVERLEEVEPPETASPLLTGEHNVRLAVSDLQSMVKIIRLADTGSVGLEDRLKFELIQSLLEDAQAFCFDYVSTGMNERHLGFIWRREYLADLSRRLGLASLPDGSQVSYRARSIALGRGYLAVCDGRDDNLTVLADLAGESASLCYVYNRQIVEVAAMPLGSYDLGSDTGRRRFGVDLRTLMNYKQSILLDAGISVPLTGLLLTGATVDDAMLASVRESFPIEVGRPKLHDGFFGSVGEDVRGSLPLYLTALGLTVN
jgi:hypothetical protein